MGPGLLEPSSQSPFFLPGSWRSRRFGLPDPKRYDWDMERELRRATTSPGYLERAVNAARGPTLRGEAARPISLTHPILAAERRVWSQQGAPTLRELLHGRRGPRLKMRRLIWPILLAELARYWGGGQSADADS